MGRMIFRTWLPTLLFVLAMSVIAAKVVGREWIPNVAASALILTPILWWLLMGRTNSANPLRGALVGALAGVAAHVMPLLLALLWFHGLRGARHQGEEGLGALAGGVVVFLMLGGAAVAAVVGAILGAIVTKFRTV